MRERKNNLKFLIITLIILLLMGVLPQGQNGILRDGFNLLPLGIFSLKASAGSTPDSASPDEAQRLEQENARLRQQLVDYLDLKKENERLYRYFELSRKNPKFTLKPAEVIARNPDDDFGTFVLNVCESDGVKPGDPVITEKGLVGLVAEVGSLSSTVKTVLSPELKISACGKRSGDAGVISGSAKLSGDNKTALTLIGEDNKIKRGDIVVTSGGNLPPNLIIGTALGVEYDSFDSSLYCAVELCEDIEKLESAAVITEYRGQEIENR